MAIKFWTYLETDKYNIGLSSKTIYIYDKEGNEIIKFKDLSYGYMGCVSNNQELLVVKSSEGRIAIYSLEKLELIKKFRFSKVDGSQDDNFIFSPDDKYFFNIERHVSSTKTALSIYDTKDFTLHKRLLNDNDNLVISVIEYDKELKEYFVLGFIRNSQTKVANEYFVCKLENGKLNDIKYISESEYGFFRFAKAVESAGFTEESYKWLFIFKTVSLSDLKTMNLSLSNLWNQK